MRRLFLILVVATLLVSIWGQNEDQESFGIDVSHHNGKINWEQVPDVEFVYIKATEGATYVDPMFLQNIKGAKARKLQVGAYHYFRTTSSVQKQFENYKKHVKKSDIDLIPMVDVITGGRFFCDSRKKIIFLCRQSDLRVERKTE